MLALESGRAGRETGVGLVALRMDRPATDTDADDERWGLLCDDHWDENAARLVCSCLGYTRSVCLSRGIQFYPLLTQYASPPLLPPMLNIPSLNVNSNPYQVKLSRVLHCHGMPPSDRWRHLYSWVPVENFPKGENRNFKWNGAWEGVFPSAAYLRSVVRSLSEVWDRAPAENKFGAFLASQNTSGQVLVEQWLPPEILKVAPFKKVIRFERSPQWM